MEQRNPLDDVLIEVANPQGHGTIVVDLNPPAPKPGHQGSDVPAVEHKLTTLTGETVTVLAWRKADSRDGYGEVSFTVTPADGTDPVTLRFQNDRDLDAIRRALFDADMIASGN